MIHIEKLRLQNFQTHKDTSLSFSPTFNCIIGPSRTGKSSVIRALDFLFYNDWHKSYQRFGTKLTTITATLSDGTILTRAKSDKVNRAALKTKEGTKKFEGFGVTLPREIIDALGIVPVEIDSDSFSVNVANQDEPQFLLYCTGTVRTKILSRLSGLHWIDYALKDLNKDRKGISTKIQNLKSTTDSLDEKLSEFENLVEYRSLLEGEKVRLDKVRSLAVLCQRGETLAERVDEWKKAFSQLQELESYDFATSILKLEKNLSIYTDVYLKLKDLDYRVGSITNSLKNIRTHLDSLEVSRGELETSLAQEFKNQPTCPTCGGVIDPIKFQEML